MRITGDVFPGWTEARDLGLRDAPGGGRGRLNPAVVRPPLDESTCRGDARSLTGAAVAPAIFGEVSGRLEQLLRQAFPDAREVWVEDRTGGGDHFQVTVASPRFNGLSLVAQHRLVYDALADPLADGSIHELRITTRGDA